MEKYFLETVSCKPWLWIPTYRFVSPLKRWNHMRAPPWLTLRCSISPEQHIHNHSLKTQKGREGGKAWGDSVDFKIKYEKLCFFWVSGPCHLGKTSHAHKVDQSKLGRLQARPLCSWRGTGLQGLSAGIPSLGKLRQGGCPKFQASLSYILISKPTWAT